MIDTNNIRLRLDGDSEEIEDIRKNLSMLYATRAGSLPLNRDFGLEGDFISQPLPVAKSEFEFEVIRKTEIYEPRVRVEKVVYEYDSTNGAMKPIVYLKGGAS